jgi:plastocyanin
MTILLAAAVLLAGCGQETPTTRDAPGPSSGDVAGGPAGQVDPRNGGLRVALGEWAVTPEVPAVRPGEITFLIANQGTLSHGFEIEREDRDEGLKVESRLIGPGDTVRLSVDLSEGLYKIECFVEGHDDLGMETLFEVRPDAPLVDRGTGVGAGATEVRIEGFTFQPETLSVPVGAEVTWSNADPTEHTVTGGTGTFDSGVLASRAHYSATFDRAGTFGYACSIHPQMTGTIEVA